MKIFNFNLFLMFGFFVITIAHYEYLPLQVNPFLYLIYFYQLITLNVVFMSVLIFKKLVLKSKNESIFKYLNVSALMVILIFNFILMIM